MIPGITTRERLPRLGKIRLGEKGKNAKGTEYPKKLDHFNFVDVPELAEAFGGECREISPVYLPSDDENIFFPTARKAYRASGLFCACSDGETATRVFVDKDEQGAAWLEQQGQTCKPGEMFDMPCPGEECPYSENKYCKPIGRLFVVLPDIPRFGVYEIATSSYNSMVNVISATRSIRRAVGTVAGVPLALTLAPMQVQPDGKKTTVYVLNLEYRGSVMSLAALGRRIEGKSGLLMLEEAEDRTPDDLFAQAGGSLDRKLAGERKVRMPERKTVDAVVTEEYRGHIDKVEDKIASNKSTYHVITSVDGDDYYTFHNTPAATARESIEGGAPVVIVWKLSKKDTREIVSLTLDIPEETAEAEA